MRSHPAHLYVHGAVQEGVWPQVGVLRVSDELPGDVHLHLIQQCHLLKDAWTWVGRVTPNFDLESRV